MSNGNGDAVIIVKKKKKGGHAAHHGGAWKVAYADFVTAMMAFFLLLWLLNVTTDEQRRGLADYFDPGAVSRSHSGSGGVLGGLTIGQPGQMSSPSARFSMDRSLPGRPYAAEDSHTLDEGEVDEPPESEPEAARRAAVAAAAAQDGAEALEQLRETMGEQEFAAALAEYEQQQFEAAEAELRQAIQSMPELQALARNLMIEQAPEGLRIQIVDQERYSMFPRGSASMHDRTHQLLALVAQAIEQMPNEISISGHTDSTPYADGGGYDNWDLSTDRANASRRALAAAGIDPDRIATVVGLADTEPMLPDAPTDPRNRRISIVLLREAPVPGRAAPAGDDAAEP
jgi:chemotaxis protein MotB